MTLPRSPLPLRRRLVEAFRFFNVRLFGGQLPQPHVTLRPQSGTYGLYYSTENEIAINADLIACRSVADVLGTLVHEMCHHWQVYFGSVSDTVIHNDEWADAMERLGLMPSHDGEPGGQRTGENMTHYVVPGGPFDVACTELLAKWRRRRRHLRYRRLRLEVNQMKTLLRRVCKDMGLVEIDGWYYKTVEAPRR